MQTYVDVARRIALEAHAGQINKHDGTLYLLHVNDVANDARQRAVMWEADPIICEAVAWLHDVVEDTTWTLNDIRVRFNSFGFDKAVIAEILDAVELLTKPGNGSLTNEQYYQAMEDNPFARVVKLADLTNNFSKNHKIEDPDTRLRMGLKYSLGMSILS